MKNSVNTFRINHYWCRDIHYFLSFKIPRREKWGHSKQQMFQDEENLNAEFDNIIIEFN
jgi:hypothetical protein